MACRAGRALKTCCNAQHSPPWVQLGCLAVVVLGLPNMRLTLSTRSNACRADKAREYERKLEYLRREEELIREEEMEAEALLQSDRPTLHTDQTAPEVGWNLPKDIAAGCHAEGLCRRLCAARAAPVSGWLLAG